MAVAIHEVEKSSIASRLGIAPGDTLVSINGHDIFDVLDYRFYMASGKLAISLLSGDGAPYERRVRKGEYDDLGLGFETYLMDKQRFCRNKCVFCFIDQLPGGMRDTLYFKDDDSRMSFLFGNYITLTNLREDDVDRMIHMRISPVNISVHTTNPRLRVQMMMNPKAGEVLGYIPRLTGAGIKVNAQLVLCPGFNDGEELTRSLRDLTALAPHMQSIAVVPVGLTGHRDGLSPLRLFTAAEAEQVIRTVDRFGGEMMQKHGTHVCFSADEFYLAAGRTIPPGSFYEEFAQLENGVGLLALLMEEFSQALEDTSPRQVTRSVTIATGRAPYACISGLAAKAMERFPGLCAEVVPIENNFFGQTITVAGLVTGGDLLAQLKGRELGDALIFPSAMLRHERDRFLDDVTVEQVEAALLKPVIPVDNDGYALLDALLGTGGNVKESQQRR